ncbi:MAG TPA: 30S ribosomal protein S20 [Candidatus Paceibacterota bacterium]|nr:30S ribosomal protein S20 [Candidatus Paceibacterota bacterium]
MAITKSAKKVIRVSGRRRLHNLRRAEAMRAAGKALAKSPSAASLAAAYAAVDKAAGRGVISKAAAGRRKARLAKLVK